MTARRCIDKILLNTLIDTDEIHRSLDRFVSNNEKEIRGTYRRKIKINWLLKATEGLPA